LTSTIIIKIDTEPESIYSALQKNHNTIDFHTFTAKRWKKETSPFIWWWI